MGKLPAIFFAALLICGLLSGCLIIPVDYYTPFSRQNIDENPLASVRVGVNTREEVLGILGEPDNVSVDESEFWYVAEKVVAVLIAGDRGSEIIRSYVHFLRFNNSGIVESQQLAPVDTILVYQEEPHFSGAGSRHH